MKRDTMQAGIAMAALLVLSVIGLIAGSPNVFNADSFGDILRAFASDTKTKAIFALILVDVVTGIVAALRVGLFDAQRIAAFYRTNVLPYLLGYLLYWLVALFGVNEFLPPAIGDALTAIGFGAISTALIGSTLDNLRRARDGVTPPETVAMANDTIRGARG